MLSALNATADQIGGEVGVTLHTLSLLGNGFIITAILWGAATAELIDRRFRASALYLITGAVLLPLRSDPFADSPGNVPAAVADGVGSAVASGGSLWRCGADDGGSEVSDPRCRGCCGNGERWLDVIEGMDAGMAVNVGNGGVARAQGKQGRHAGFAGGVELADGVGDEEDVAGFGVHGGGDFAIAGGFDFRAGVGVEVRRR